MEKINNIIIPVKVIIYCRVSSKKQVTEGNGLDSQEQVCRNWAKQRGYTVERVFREEGISGSKEDRPAFKDMLDFLVNTDEKYIVLALDINRFARDTVVYGALRDKIRRLGHSMQTVNMTLEETEESELLENVSASLGQYERKKNAKRTKMNMMEHAKQGYWVLQPPTGYMRKRIDRRVHLVRNEPTATYLQNALEGFANGRFLTQKDVFDFLQDKTIMGFNNKPIKVTLNFVKNILKNEKYTGYFDYPRWNIPQQYWRIEPIITQECFKAIQDRLNGRKAQTKARKYNKTDEDFPLRRWVKCAVCGHLMTADKPRSKSGKHHLYYHCYNKECPMCNKNIPQKVMHEDFENILIGITPAQDMLNLVMLATERAYKNNNADIDRQNRKIQNDIKEKQKLVGIVEENLAFATDKTTKNACVNQINKLEQEIQSLKDQQIEQGKETMPLGFAIEYVKGFVSNPLQIWLAGDYSQKQGVLNLCFANKISYDKVEKFRTPALSPIFAVFDKNTGILEEWRTTISKNPNAWCDEIIKMAEYIGDSSLLDLIYQISQHKEYLADSSNLNATKNKNTVYKGEK